MASIVKLQCLFKITGLISKLDHGCFRLKSEGKSRLSASRHGCRTVASLSDRASMSVDQALRFVGVDTNDARLSLLFAVATQAARTTENGVRNVALEAVKYVNPRRGDAQNFEDALMTVPDLETIPSTTVFRTAEFEIREVEEYTVAETDMQTRQAFDFMGSSRAFNTLAGYLFGDNTRREEMEMTTPVITRPGRERGVEMEMTTPVLSSQDEGKWRMSFVMPSKYAKEGLPIPNNKEVNIRKVPARTIAVVAFPGVVSDAEVSRREEALRKALERDTRVAVKAGAKAEVAQYNPPFTPPFARRNEVSLEVEWV